MNKHKKIILIVDDNEGIVVSLTMVLEHGGYKVVSLMSGIEAKNIKAPFPDLILLDIWMPSITGLEVCRHLKAHKNTKDIPIIMTSAYPDAATSALLAGADGFIEKPYTLEKIFALIEEHLGGDKPKSV